ncbi:hypothetical protein WDU94_013599 [Cyamophila willieti]
MSRDQLEQFALRIRSELEREREERNFFQVERDKLRSFWEITRQQLEESRAALRNQDRALEEAAEKHEQEIKQFKQKVKHLMFEHESHLSDLEVHILIKPEIDEAHPLAHQPRFRFLTSCKYVIHPEENLL